MHYPVNVFTGKVREYDGSRPSAIAKIQVDGELTLTDLGLAGEPRRNLPAARDGADGDGRAGQQRDKSDGQPAGLENLHRTPVSTDAQPWTPRAG